MNLLRSAWLIVRWSLHVMGASLKFSEWSLNSARILKCELRWKYKQVERELDKSESGDVEWDSEEGKHWFYFISSNSPALQLYVFVPGFFSLPCTIKSSRYFCWYKILMCVLCKGLLEQKWTLVDVKREQFRGWMQWNPEIVVTMNKVVAIWTGQAALALLDEALLLQVTLLSTPWRVVCF